MLPASKQFSEAVVTDTRRVLGRVIVDYTDPFMDQGISISASEQINPATMLPQVADNILTPARRWASCDGSTLVDGNSFPAPAVAADGQMGWWGSQLSDTGSMFIATFPTVTLTFISRPIHSLRVVGDSARGEFPVDFEIRLLGVGSVVRHTQIVTGNALVDWQVNIIPVTEVTQYVVEVRRWSHAGRQAKVLEAFTSVQETYEGDDIIGISLLEERELAQQSLPVGNVSANEITLKLDNSTRKFDAGNRQSPLYQLLVQNRRIRAWLGVLPEKATTETTQADWAAGTLHSVRATGAGDLVLDEAVRTAFARESVAYSQNGTLVNTNLPRFEPGNFGQAVMVEEGTTNLISPPRPPRFSSAAGPPTIQWDIASNFRISGTDGPGGLLAFVVQPTNLASADITAFTLRMENPVNTFRWVIQLIDVNGAAITTGWSPAIGVFNVWYNGWVTTGFAGGVPLTFSGLPAGVRGIGFGVRSSVSNGGQVCSVDRLQIEARSYATSFIDGTRAAEVLTVPSSVFNRGNWTVEGIYTPQIPMTLGNILKTLKSYQIDANNNLWFGITADARWRLAITSGGTVRAVESATGAAVIGTPYHWQIGGDGSVMRLCVNGVETARLPYVEPVGDFPATISLGNRNNAHFANGLIHNVRFSNRARTLAEHQATFNSGQPLAVDAATTYLARFDGSLLNSAYLLSGTRTSPAVDMSFLTETETAISSWTAAIPIGTALAVETSLNEGSSWHTATNGGQIAGIVAGQNMVGIRLLTRQVLTTQDAGVTPQLHGLTITQINRDYVPLGTFWSGEWHATSEKLYASTTGRDRLELLRKSTYAMSQVAVNRSLHALATAVLTDAGLTTAEYWIDPALHNIIVPSAWFSTLSHREALRQIAEASLGQVYTDRNGVVRVESVGHLLGQESFVNPLMTSTQSLTITADNYFRKDTPIKWGELANRVEVETQPLRAVATTQEVFRSNEPVAIAAGQTVVLTVRYNEPPVIEAVASLSGAPAGAAITAATYFAWGATVTVTNGTNAGTFTLLINGKLLTILNRERATAEDLVSIRDNGLLRYEYPANHLVQTLARAQTIADTLLRLYRHPRRDLTMDWRGNPALTLGDMIITRDHQDWLRYWVTKQEIDYDGALRARLEGRLAR